MRADCDIRGYLGARIRKEEGESIIILCASCGFQTDKRVLTPGWGGHQPDSVLPCDQNHCQVGIFGENPGRSPLGPSQRILFFKFQP